LCREVPGERETVISVLLQKTDIRISDQARDNYNTMFERYGNDKINRNLVIGTLIFFTVVGAAVRLYKLGFQCSWTEEDYTAMVAAMPVKDMWAFIMQYEINPPLFYWIERGVGLVFGISDTTMRYVPAVAGVLCIPAMYLLGKTYKDEFTGLFCAGFTSVSYVMIYYSQYARAYTVSFLCFTLFLVMYLHIHKGNTERRLLVGLGVLAGLNAWVHLYSLIPVTMLMLDTVWLLVGKKDRVSLGYLVGAFMVTVLPLIQMPLHIVSSRVRNAELTYGLEWWELIATTPGEFFNNFFPIVGLMIVFGLFLERDNWVSVKLFVMAVVTILSGLALSLVTPIYPRYYMTVSAVFILLSAVSFGYFTEYIRRDWTKVSVLIMFLILFVTFENGALISHTVSQMNIC
jgi:uncharacterized membrane protein